MRTEKSPAAAAVTTDPLIDRESLLGAQACRRRYAVIDTPIGRVRLRSLNERERSRFETDIVSDDLDADRERMIDAKRRLIVLTVVDAEGNPILDDEDVVGLGDVDGALIGELFDAAQKLSGFKRGDIETLAKNSRGGRGDDSP